MSIFTKEPVLLLICVALNAVVGWVAPFNPTDLNANTFFGVATLSLLGEGLLPILY